MAEDPALPHGLCRTCFEHTLAAVHFKRLCLQSNQHWNEATSYLSQIHEPANEDKTFYIFYNEGMAIIKDQIERVPNISEALKKLNNMFQEPELEKPKRTKRSIAPMSCYCPDCGKTFANTEVLNYHLKNSLKRACQLCGLVTSKKALSKHLTDKHDVSSVECKSCNSLFDSKSSYEQHWLRCHGPNTHSCQFCGKGFNNRRALRAHLYSHTLFHCKSCNKSFENRSCFKHHQNHCKMTDEPKPEVYICDYCNIEYSRKPSLRIHIIQKHLNILPYVCQECGKRTSTMAHLKSHQRTHNTVRRVYQCYCGAKMRTELGYQLHQRIHSGERPYECDACGDRFLSASRRLDHIKRRHRSTNDMQHACDKCSARFVRPWELKKHYLTVHYDVVDDLPTKTKEAPLRRRFKYKFKQ